MTNKPEQSISDIIREKITNRVFWSLFVLFAFLLVFAVYDIGLYFQQFKTNTHLDYNVLQSFMQDHLSAGDEASVVKRIHRLNDFQDVYQVRWIQNATNTEEHFSLTWSLGWRIQYPNVVDGQPASGYVVYQGKIYNLPAFSRFVALILGYVLIFLVTVRTIYPLYHKVPQELMIRPIEYMLSIIRSKQRIKKDETFKQLPTEIKDILFSIEKLVREVESSTKEMATYKFASRVAHDIRSPLAVLGSAVEEYKQTKALDVETITAVCRRISKIADDIIMQNHPNDKQHSIIVPYLVAKEVVNEKRYLAKKTTCDVDFSFSEAVKTLFCEANALELGRVLSNLINNAMEALTEDGHVHLHVDNDADKIVITIKDDGAGMPEHVKQNILSGQSISTKTKGSGIGLKSATDYIQSLSGRLMIDSVINEGTTLTIHLPIANMPGWFLNHLDLDIDDSILVVDDERIVYQHWQTCLKKFAIHMHYISGSEKSVKAFNFIQESQYDLYLLDYQNPLITKDGFDMIREYQLKDKAVLVTSNYDDAALQKLCLQHSIKMMPKGYMSDLSVSVVNREADIYLIEDDELFAKAFCRQADLQSQSVYWFWDVFNCLRNLKHLNKSAKFFIDLNIESKQDGFYMAKRLAEEGFCHIFILSGEDALTLEHAPLCVRGLFNKATFDWRTLHDPITTESS